MSLDDALDCLDDGRVLVDLGQLADIRGTLEQMAKRGEISMWLGCRAPVAGAHFGVGPLKLCFGSHHVRAELVEFEAG